MPMDLVAARAAHWEDPNSALDVAVGAEATGRRTGDDALVVRALALQGTIALNRGDLRTALALATEADQRVSEEAVARAELAALKSQLAFFSGSYADSLSHAEAAMALADTFGDLALRVFVRRAACMVLGTVGVPGGPSGCRTRSSSRSPPATAGRRRSRATTWPAGTSARAGSTTPRPRSPAGSRSRGGSSGATSRSGSCTRPAPTSGCSPAAPTTRWPTPSARSPTCARSRTRTRTSSASPSARRSRRCRRSGGSTTRAVRRGRARPPRRASPVRAQHRARHARRRAA